MAAELTADERVFIERMAPHIERGLSFEDAARAVLADDERLWLAATAGTMGQDVTAELKAGLAAIVYRRIRSQP